ncbi:hypothetical protein EUX98_g6406 [Antrodiella citrinella]|uniref:F-box domain-containing protein n=1 Tax=Antrodiella citrinella TaxID=2447956 RepID=A0A4V3XI67_9APHY|nr:hypothetical protein EUX98_g6406 [Antrodiella citrinella]
MQRPQSSISIYRRVPYELYDAIFTHVVDKRSLAACTLISRDSLVTAQQHLFRSITINHRNSAEFLGFVRSTSHRSLARHIEELKLNGSHTTFSTSYFSTVLADLPSLRRLELMCVVLETTTASTIANPSSRSPPSFKLEELFLNEYVLSLFCDIGTLTLDVATVVEHFGVRVTEQEQDLRFRTSKALLDELSVGTLIVQSGGGSTLWLISRSNMRIQGSTLTTIGPRNSLIAHRILEVFGPKLRDLSLTVGRVSPGLDISQCKALSRLRIQQATGQDPTFKNDSEGSDILRHISALPASLSHFTLDLRVSVTAGYVHKEVSHGWAALDAALVSVAKKGVHVVCMIAMPEWLPLSLKSGIVQ